MSSPLKVVNIASSVGGISRKITTIRIVAIVVLVFLGFLAVGAGIATVKAYLAPLAAPMGNCHADSQSQIASQTGTANFTSTDQQQNAQLIINAVAKRNLPKRAAIIALATAMQESSLVNVNYGDDRQGVRNPDGSLTTSRGLFQQQDSWGPLSIRLDPMGAAGLFLDRLVGVANWQSLPLSQAAQAVQRSGLPDAYAKWEARATEIADQKPPTEGNYGTATGSASPVYASGTSNNVAGCGSGSSGVAGIGTGSGKGDDYPQAQKDLPVDSVDPWGYLTGECVSFVAWRMNVQMGWKPGDPWKFSASAPAMDGRPFGLLGSAVTWEGNLISHGYKSDSIPAPGAIAWWDAYSSAGGITTGEYGHVAVVSKVYDDGTIDIEQYNEGNRHQYSTMHLSASIPTRYIHVADVP